MAERRILIIWLENWVADIHCPADLRAEAFGVTQSRQGGDYLADVNLAARQCGLRPDMRLTDARALVPNLKTTCFDSVLSQRLLKLCVQWATRFTPWVGQMEDHDLVLDITGCAHLFGGERRLTARIMAALAKRHINARIAVAGTIGAAWALAHYGSEPITLLPLGQEREALRRLPPAALRLDATTLALCHKLGLSRIEILAKLPRNEIRRRIHPDALSRLDEAVGYKGEVVSPARPLPVYQCQQSLAQPITELETIQQYLSPLIAALCADLVAAGRGAKRVDLRLTATDGRQLGQSIYLSKPVALASHITRLFEDRLERLSHSLVVTYGIDDIYLCASQTVPLTARQSGFVDLLLSQNPTEIGQAFFALCDRLGERLGQTQLLRSVPHANHIPERAISFVPSLAVQTVPACDPATPDERPIIMLPRAEPVEVIADIPEGPPRRFRWRRRLYTVVRAQGPERLSPAWWQSIGQHKVGTTRDYFRVEDDNGHRFWVYRDALYTEAVAPPVWYMHGFFA